MKLDWSLVATLIVFTLAACTAGVNGVTVSSRQQYFSPYTASEEGRVAIEARPQFGTSANLNDRAGQINLSAKTGQT